MQWRISAAESIEITAADGKRNDYMRVYIGESTEIISGQATTKVSLRIVNQNH